MHTLGSLSPRFVFGSLAGLLVGLTFACGPVAAPPSTPAAADPFAVVRATSEAAYQTGKAFVDRGDLQGCPLIDTAKTTDPDNRPEIQQALEQCLTAIALLPTAAPPTPGQRTIVIATLPLVVPPSATLTVPAATPQGASNPAVSPGASPAAASQPAATGEGAARVPNLVAWRDPQGRFSIGAPMDWLALPQPQALFGSGVIQFRDPSGRVEVNVAVDSAAKAVSPELYAASMDIAMQQQVPGYAGEQVIPADASGQPAVRRVFTFTQHDAAGNDLQARSFLVTVLKGATPYIISGSAPAEQFEQYRPTFDEMVQSFRFS
ncbi:MAG: DUF1795 domain-containing protein [Chloroflexi bacterium]|nr:DUF1795 domain-containing protein [Chloroflexota bacterium]